MGLKKIAKQTRAELEAIINSGRSVIHDGQIITRIMDLPTEAELAIGNPDLEKATVEILDGQIARLTAEREKLNAASSNGGTAPSAPAPDPAKTAADDKAAADKASADARAALLAANPATATVAGTTTDPAKAAGK